MRSPIMYSTFSGTFDIFVNDSKVGAYDNTGSFGELALMYNTPRAATIVATSTGAVWALVSPLFSRCTCKSKAWYELQIQ